MPKPVPIKTLNWERIEQRQEMSLDQIIVSGVPASPIGKDQVIGL